MFTPGNILYFTPFYFKNGAASKNKYFIVLKDIDGQLILASLPSSRIKLPHRIPENHGCIEVPEGCINCYLFVRDRVIGQNGFAFPLLTAIYGEEIAFYQKDVIENQYPLENIHYKVVDRLLPQELEAVLECLRSSSSVSRKYKRVL
jgi:hypothetical protein